MIPHLYRLLPLVLAAAFAGPAAAVSQDSGFDRAAWQDDYASLKQSLQRNYANLAWLGSRQGGVDLPALDRQTQRALASAENDAQAEQAIRDFVAGFHDGHFSFQPMLESALDNTAKPAAELSKTDLASMEAASGCAAIGVAPAQHSGFSLPFETLHGFRLLSDGLDQPLRTGLYDSGTGLRIGLLRLPEFEPGAYPGLCRMQWQQVRAGDRGMTGALADAISATLHGFSKAGVDVVLVDVGANPGGGDIGDGFVRLFTDHAVRSAPLLVTQSSVGLPYLDEQIERLSGALKRHPNQAVSERIQVALKPFEEGKRAIVGGKPCDLSWVWRERHDWNDVGCRRLVPAGTSGGPVDALPTGAVGELPFAHRLSWAEDYREDWASWTGPVYVLSDGKTYSAAEMFVARMRDNGIAKTVGQRTGGDGCGFMDSPAPMVLPHSRLRLRMPNCVRLRADGSDEVAGIVPDLPVMPREGEDARSRALRVLSAVTADRPSQGAH